ncbi:MAG: hypothetical protein IKA76_05230 [Clostridia bacterium]|nr:hypothetical protein [Clostridia bacterium]
MKTLSVDFARTVGRIKPMHGVGHAPFLGMKYFDPMDHLVRAGIPFVRLHDMGLTQLVGPHLVDVPNIFPDFDADEHDPDSYDFAFTDRLIAALAERGLNLVYRLGVSIENYQDIRAYRIHPPKDFPKWARICEHIVRHYNEGWADGFHYGIRYWEIWNEPENAMVGKNQMWTGTAEQFYELYATTASHLKACFGDSVMVGGYAASGLYGALGYPERFGWRGEPIADRRYQHEREIMRIEFLQGFLSYIKERKAPLDFFSWHSYVDVEETAEMAEYLRALMERYGYGEVETHLNEWNNSPRYGIKRGTSAAEAKAAAMLLRMQDSPTDVLCYYQAGVIAIGYDGMFDPVTFQPYPLYDSFLAFDELYRMGEQCEVKGTEKGFYAVAAKGEASLGLMCVNVTGEAQTVKTNLTGDFSVWLLDAEHRYVKTDLNPSEFSLANDQVAMVKN